MSKGKIFLILQSIVCISLTVLLALSAVSIFREGSARKAENPLESIYTPAAAAAKFAPIAPLFFISLGMLAAGLLLGVRDERAEKPVQDAEISRDLTAARVTEPSGAMRKERLIQKRLTLTGWGLFALCMIPSAVYLMNPAHFPPDNLEGMIAGLIRVLLPMAAPVNTIGPSAPTEPPKPMVTEEAMSDEYMLWILRRLFFSARA